MKKNSRVRGLLLMGTGALLFLGTNMSVLPAEAFFPAVPVCLLGIVVFMKGNREAARKTDNRIRKALDPGIGNETTKRFAERQAEVDGHVLASIEQREARAPAPSRPALPVSRIDRDEIVLVHVDESKPAAHGAKSDFVVDTDVSFPVELQETTSLADQLQKLKRLLEDGVITVEEFSIAKAKLLR